MLFCWPSVVFCMFGLRVGGWQFSLETNCPPLPTTPPPPIIVSYHYIYMYIYICICIRIYIPFYWGLWGVVINGRDRADKCQTLKWLRFPAAEMCCKCQNPKPNK